MLKAIYKNKKKQKQHRFKLQLAYKKKIEIEDYFKTTKNLIKTMGRV